MAEPLTPDRKTGAFDAEEEAEARERVTAYYNPWERPARLLATLDAARAEARKANVRASQAEEQRAETLDALDEDAAELERLRALADDVSEWCATHPWCELHDGLAAARKEQGKDGTAERKSALQSAEEEVDRLYSVCRAQAARLQHHQPNLPADQLLEQSVTHVLSKLEQFQREEEERGDGGGEGVA